MLSCISNITIDGADLILERVFDDVGFNRIKDDIFRKLVKARLSYPSSKRGCNKFLKMEGYLKVTINYDKLETDSKWDGLKGYLTNTDIPVEEVYTAYHNLWHVEKAFRIAKSKIEIRPMFHFTRKRIEAHVCICFVALKIYKELERLLKLSAINMNVDKVLALAQTIVTIQLTLPKNKTILSKTMLLKRHQRIAPLFSDEFWVTR